MTTDSAQTQWTVQALLDLFDVQPDGENRFIAETGPAGEDERQVVEGTQVLAQMIVAAAKRFPEKSVRSVYAVFARAVMVGAGPVEFEIDVVSEGRSTATAVVAAKQNGKRCITVDGARRRADRRRDPPSPAPTGCRRARRCERLGDADDRAASCGWSTSSTSTAPTRWARRSCTPGCTTTRSPTRDDLAKALDRVLHWAPWDFDDDARARRHRHRQSHLTVSTAPMTVSVSFHEPVRWDGWLLYTHESTQVGAGMSYVRGAVHTEEGELIASFAQDALIRPLRTTDTAIKEQSRL